MQPMHPVKTTGFSSSLQAVWPKEYARDWSFWSDAPTVATPGEATWWWECSDCSGWSEWSEWGVGGDCAKWKWRVSRWRCEQWNWNKQVIELGECDDKRFQSKSFEIPKANTKSSFTTSSTGVLEGIQGFQGFEGWRVTGHTQECTTQHGCPCQDCSNPQMFKHCRSEQNWSRGNNLLRKCFGFYATSLNVGCRLYFFGDGIWCFIAKVGVPLEGWWLPAAKFSIYNFHFFHPWCTRKLVKAVKGIKKWQLHMVLRHDSGMMLASSQACTVEQWRFKTSQRCGVGPHEFGGCVPHQSRRWSWWSSRWYFVSGRVYWIRCCHGTTIRCTGVKDVKGNSEWKPFNINKLWDHHKGGRHGSSDICSVSTIECPCSTKPGKLKTWKPMKNIWKRYQNISKGQRTSGLRRMKTNRALLTGSICQDRGIRFLTLISLTKPSPHDVLRNFGRFRHLNFGFSDISLTFHWHFTV